MINQIWTIKELAPGEARTHNPGITHCTVYKYRALTDCATGAYWTKGTHARCGVRTHAILRLWELKSHALDHSANLALIMVALEKRSTTTIVWGCSSVVERSIRIRDARGSIPLISNQCFALDVHAFKSDRWQKIWQRWDSNPRPERLVPKTSALDHSATLPVITAVPRTLWVYMEKPL